MPCFNRIKEFCDRRKMTSYEVAKIIQVHPATMRNLYNDPSSIPSASVLNAICDIFEVHPKTLIDWENSKKIVDTDKKLSYTKDRK